jgi:phage terminase large subunit
MKRNERNERIIEVTDLYYKLLESKSRYILMRGSTRSSKTFSIIQYLLTRISQEDNLQIIIGVETLAKAKATILKDITEIIYDFGLDIKFNKSEMEYYFKNNTIKIMSADNPSRWHGVKADIFFFNEATHIDYDIFEQASIRLTDNKNSKFILDYNPTNPYSWVRELEMSNRPGGVETIVSTYKDNPFLNDLQIRTIENLKEINYNKWLIYAKGEYGETEGAIFRNWDVVDEFPKNVDIWYGMDFGFTNDPTTLIRVCIYNNELYCDEMLYEVGMTNQDIIDFLKDINLENDEIIADSAEPKSIEEIRRGGIRNIIGADKGKDSIKIGIDILQRYKIHITKNSKNLHDELVNYTWKKNKNNGEFINIPSEGFDHCFTKDTQIQTLYGKRTISNIIKGDCVLTRCGYKKVLSSWCSGNKQIFNYKIDDLELNCTDNHKIKINGKWKQIKKLKQKDVIMKHKSLMVKFTNYTNVKNILREVEDAYIEKFGSITKDLFQKDITYITLMAIQKIIQSKIYNWLKEKNICHIIVKNGVMKIKNLLKKIWIKLDHSQKNGTHQKKELNGIDSKPYQQDLVIILMEKLLVKYVVKSLKRKKVNKNSVLISASLNGEEIKDMMIFKSNVNIVEKNSQKINILKLDFVETSVVENLKVTKLKVEPVYDLEIEDKHEFFANNILVHNCIDPIRYIALIKLKLKSNDKIIFRSIKR